MKSKSRRFLTLVGHALSVAGIGFVIFALREQSLTLSSVLSDRKLLLAVALSVGLWQIVNLAIALGWAKALALLTFRISNRQAVVICLQTQIAKYIPGNVFHLLNRAVLLKQAKGTAAAGIYGMVLESVILVMLGALIGAMYLLEVRNTLLLIAIPVILGVLVMGLVWKYLRLPKGRIRPQSDRNVYWLNLAIAFSYYSCVFLVQAFIFWILLTALDSEVSIRFGELYGLITIAWIAGYLVIGAPGGLGVREGVFGVLVAEQSASAEYVMVMVVVRIVSILGDCLSYACTRLASREGLHYEAVANEP